MTVFERKDRIGGLLRYGIPDFKLEKWVLDRRIALMESEGIRFRTNANVGDNVPVPSLLDEFDAVLLAGGSTVPRDLPVPGRDLNGVYFAMEFLEQNNRRIAGDPVAEAMQISAKGKEVLVIGGGDTGADCVGTSNRQGAASVTQIEVLAMPPKEREPNSWPNWPMVLRSSSSHEEGCSRHWAIQTKAFLGDEQGNLRAAQIVDVRWETDPATGRNGLVEVEGTLREIPCQLAFLAVGFLHPLQQGMLEQLGVELDERGNVRTNETYQTNHPQIFSAGDMRRGQSLVVWAISEGREAARCVDACLMGSSSLEAKAQSPLAVPV